MKTLVFKPEATQLRKLNFSKEVRKAFVRVYGQQPEVILHQTIQDVLKESKFPQG